MTTAGVCTGTTYDGSPCERAAVGDEAWPDRCPWHGGRRKRCWSCGAVWGYFDERTGYSCATCWRAACAGDDDGDRLLAELEGSGDWRG